MGLMNEAFDMVIQLGLEGPKIEEAKKKRDELTALDSAQKTLASCVKTIEVKVFSKGGIVEGDSAPLADAISDAKAKVRSREERSDELGMRYSWSQFSFANSFSENMGAAFIATLL